MAERENDVQKSVYQVYNTSLFVFIHQVLFKVIKIDECMLVRPRSTATMRPRSRGCSFCPISLRERLKRHAVAAIWMANILYICAALTTSCNCNCRSDEDIADGWHSDRTRWHGWVSIQLGPEFTPDTFAWGVRGRAGARTRDHSWEKIMIFCQKIMINLFN